MDEQGLARALVEKGLLTEELAQKLLTEAQSLNQSFESLIYGRRLLNEEAVAEAKSVILGIPYEKVTASTIPADVLKLIPQETASNYRLAPLEFQNNMLIVGMVEPSDTKAQEALRFIAKQKGLSLGVYLITPSDLEMILRRYSPYQSEVEEAVKVFNVKPSGGLSAAQRKISLEASAGDEDAPIIRVVSSTLKEAVERGASDVHIEPQRTRVRVRFRLDGVLEEVSSFPPELAQPLISRVKIMAELKIDETRMPQDGRFRTEIFGRDIDYRVSTFPTPMGEKVAIRVLDPTVGLKKISDLGLTGHNADLVTKGIAKPYGMVLITGPTGSGKTTTLYALLQILNKEGVNVLSMEDPVEYFIDGVNQSQVRPEIGYTFASGLRQAVRQDPDIIMVGEVRDNETADLAIEAALTGHIVLSTLHTNDAVGVIPRLIDMKVEPFLLPSSLNLMVAQRLIGRLCNACKKPEPATGEALRIIQAEFPKSPESEVKDPSVGGGYQIYHAPGCKECKGKGIVGRIALFEVLNMTRELGELISAGFDEEKIRAEARRQGMTSLRQDGVLKALQGLVSLEEVLNETVET